jgi:hypothetical protein
MAVDAAEQNYVAALNDRIAAPMGFFADPVMCNGFANHGESLHRQFPHCNQNELNLLRL